MENKQIAITEFGGVENLVLQTRAIPEPQEGEVVVKVAFSGVNPIDVKTRAGLGWAAAQNKDNLPWVPGYDISGQVIACGESAERFSVGANVAGFIGFPLQGGGYSQYVAVPESALSAVPDSVTLEAAAALPLASQTAAQALNKAEVYTTCSEANLDYLATLGAHAINYQFAPASERVSDVDVLIDLVGGDTALDALKCLKDGARVVTVPTLSAELICEKAKLLGFTASGMLVEPQPEQMDTMLYMVSVGLLKTEVQRIFPMEEAQAAHLQVETGHTRGKVLLDMKC